MAERSQTYLHGRAQAWEDTRPLFDPELSAGALADLVDTCFARLAEAEQQAHANEDYAAGYEECLFTRLQSAASLIFGVQLRMFRQ